MSPAALISTDVADAANRLRSGGLVAFATETVYGLGANALVPEAVARIFEAKGRPKFDPLIVHIADHDWLPKLVSEIPKSAEILIKNFWPGPLTIVLPKTDIVPELVTAGLATVAIRMPNHPQALELLRKANVPVAAPSANRFGHVSPTTAAHVANQLGDKLDFILDGGPCGIGLESTVLSLADKRPTLLRPGGLTREEIEAVTGPIEVAANEAHPMLATPSAPGMLPRHYAPRTTLTIAQPEELTTSSDNWWKRHSDSARLGLISRGPLSGIPIDRFQTIEVLSRSNDLAEAAANFFAALHRLDNADLDLIVALPFPTEGLGLALNDRLERAAYCDEE